MKQSCKIQVILTFVIVFFCCHGVDAQENVMTKVPPAMGSISGRVHIRVCPPWLGISAFLDSRGTFAVLPQRSSDQSMADTICCCPVARKGCPKCPNCPAIDAASQYEYGYNINSLPPGDYKIVLVAVDSSGIGTPFFKTGMKALAYAGMSNSFAEKQADSTAARVVRIDARHMTHTNVDVYYYLNLGH